MSEKMNDSELSLEDQICNDIITGEKFQNIADVIYITRTIFDFHHSLLHIVSREKMIFIDESDPKLPDHGSVVFVYGSILSEFVTQILSKLENVAKTGDKNMRIILLTHNSDEIIRPQSSIVHRQIVESPIIYKWFTQNNDSLPQNPKIISVPIGIANRQWRHGNINELAKIISEIDGKRARKRIPIYVNFNIATNSIIREKAMSDIFEEGKHDETGQIFFAGGTDKLPEQYWRELLTANYVVSPPGNGTDCHRFWEAIYLGVIPIIIDDDSIVSSSCDIGEKNPTYSQFEKDDVKFINIGLSYSNLIEKMSSLPPKMK
jgi:hypothetical protein